MSLLYNLGPVLFWAIAIPVSLAVAAWALKIACAICSVESPEFWQSVVTVIVVCAANAIWRYYLEISLFPLGLGTHLIAPIVITVAILAISLATDLGSALMIASVQICICAAIYLTLTTLDGLVLVG